MSKLVFLTELHWASLIADSVLETFVVVFIIVDEISVKIVARRSGLIDFISAKRIHDGFRGHNSSEINKGWWFRAHRGWDVVIQLNLLTVALAAPLDWSHSTEGCNTVEIINEIWGIVGLHCLVAMVDSISDGVIASGNILSLADFNGPVVGSWVGSRWHRQAILLTTVDAHSIKFVLLAEGLSAWSVLDMLLVALIIILVVIFDVGGELVANIWGWVEFGKALCVDHVSGGDVLNHLLCEAWDVLIQAFQQTIRFGASLELQHSWLLL